MFKINKIKLFESQWFGINFGEFETGLNAEQSNQKFYQSFYTKFLATYSEYADLDPLWRQEKNKVADTILKYIDRLDNCLSIGSGICYVEEYLAAQRPDIKIFTDDPSSVDFTAWISQKNVCKLSTEVAKQIKTVYCVQILYTLSDHELTRFFDNLRLRLPSCEKIIVVDSDLDLIYPDLKKKIFYGIFLSYAVRMLKSLLGTKFRFWGYLRSFAYIESLLLHESSWRRVATDKISNQFLAVYCRR